MVQNHDTADKHIWSFQFYDKVKKHEIKAKVAAT